MKTLRVSVTDVLHEKLKTEAKRQKMSMRQLLNAYIKESLPGEMSQELIDLAASTGTIRGGGK